MLCDVCVYRCAKMRVFSESPKVVLTSTHISPVLWSVETLPRPPRGARQGRGGGGVGASATAGHIVIPIYPLASSRSKELEKLEPEVLFHQIRNPKMILSQGWDSKDNIATSKDHGVWTSSFLSSKPGLPPCSCDTSARAVSVKAHQLPHPQTGDDTSHAECRCEN